MTEKKKKKKKKAADLMPFSDPKLLTARYVHQFGRKNGKKQF